jgi:RHS repeat-associated protein
MPTIDFLWDEWSDNVLQETDENNVVTTYFQRPEKYGEVLYHKAGSRFSFYHFDGNGSTQKLTNVSQSTIKTFIISAFGELVASSGTGSTPFAYKGAAGYYTNPVTNDIYVRARTYEPTTGRWLSKDPLGFVDGPNLYGAYFVPNGVDPTGLILRFGQEKDEVCVALLDDHADSSTPNRPAKRWIEQARRLTNNCWERVTGITEIADLVRKCQCCTLYIIGHRGGPNNPGGATTFPPGSGGEGVNILPGKPPHGGVLAREFLFLGCKVVASIL